MPASILGLGDIPPELILHICLFCSRDNLPIVALLCRLFNNFAIPLLYQSLELEGAEQAYLCCQTLSTSDHLAALVQSFNFIFPYFGGFDDLKHANFMTLMVRSVERMHNLQHYRCAWFVQLLPDMCIALFAKTKLRTICIGVPYAHELRATDPPITSLLPYFPELEVLEIRVDHYDSITPTYMELLRHIISAHSHQLRKLGIYFLKDVPGFLDRFLPHPHTLPAVTDLGTYNRVCFGPDVDQQLPNVRSLTYESWSLSVEVPELPIDSFPLLESYSGPSKRVGEVIGNGRPIRSLCLNQGYRYIPGGLMVGNYYWWTTDWSDLLEAFRYLPASTGPVRQLSFYFGSIDLDTLPDIARYLTTLEILEITLDAISNDISQLPSLGEKFLSKMPYLHTFKLRERSADFAFSTDVDFQRGVVLEWERQCPLLRSIGLTNNIVWRKGTDSWKSESRVKS